MARNVSDNANEIKTQRREVGEEGGSLDPLWWCEQRIIIIIIIIIVILDIIICGRSSSSSSRTKTVLLTFAQEQE